MRRTSGSVPVGVWARADLACNCGMPVGNRVYRVSCLAHGYCPRAQVSISLQILLCIAVVIVAAKLAATAASRLGLPLVLGELLAGVILGPSLLNIWGIHWLAHSSGG